jgi:hypothetical protein
MGMTLKEMELHCQGISLRKKAIQSNRDSPLSEIFFPF